MFQVNDKIKLLRMVNDPDPIETGSIGTITSIVNIGKETIINVDWDNNRSLNVILPYDRIVKVKL